LEVLERIMFSKRIDIYSDSLSAINIFSNFINNNITKNNKISQRLINKITYIIKLRIDNNYITNFHHVYSHILDNLNSNNIKNQNKFKIMQTKYGKNTQMILKGNQKVDNICKNKFTLKPLNLNNFFLPEYVITKNDYVIEKSTNKFLLQEYLNKYRDH
jgi:hypothetical protein